MPSKPNSTSKTKKHPCTPSSTPKVCTTPPARAQIPATPPSKLQVPTTPQSEAQVPATPWSPSGAQVPTTPQLGLHVPASTPPSGLQVPTTPKSGDQVPATPPSALQVRTTPPSELNVPATPQSGLQVPTQVPATPPSGAQVPATPPSGAQVPATPPSGLQVPATPQSGAQVPATPRSEAQLPTTPPNSQDVELEGYIHTLSPIKKPHNKSPYFACLVQTSDTSKVRAVCYETKKRTTLQQAYSSKSPVKISAVKRLPSTSFSDSLEEYKIVKMAKITPTMTDFDYNPTVASSVYNVQQALDGDVFKAIDVTAKVITKEEKKQPIFYKGKQLMKVDCVIADHTNTIKLTLWEDLIDLVECGKSYNFKNIKIRSFNDVKYLSTNEGTTIHLHHDIQDISMNTEDINFTLNITEGKCVGAKLKREPSCIACNTCLKESASEDIITCQNCQMTTLQENCNHKLVGQLMIKSKSGKIQNYTCFNDALQSFLASINIGMNIDTIELDDLRRLLLTSNFKQMIIDDSTKTITQFLL